MKSSPTLWSAAGLALAGMARSVLGSPTPGPYSLTLVLAGAQAASADVRSGVLPIALDVADGGD